MSTVALCEGGLKLRRVPPEWNTPWSQDAPAVRPGSFTPNGSRVRRFLIIGIIFSILPSIAHASFYSNIHRHVQEEMGQKTIDEDISSFVTGIINENLQRHGEETRIDSDDLAALARGDRTAPCAAKAGLREEALTQAQCTSLLGDIPVVLGEELRVRKLSRDLVGIVGGFDVSMSDALGRPFSLTLDQTAILNLWHAGRDDVAKTDTINVRTQTVTEDDIRGPLQQLGSALKALNREQLLAAVRRYRHGLRFVLDARAPTFVAPAPDAQSGPGTERQFEFKRWSGVEAALTSLWYALPEDPVSYDPPLAQDDIVLLHFPEDLIANSLPPNVLLWAQMDGDPRHTFGDVGLSWVFPEETVGPSLIRDPDAAETPVSAFILGGNFPPVIARDALCSHPLMLGGYLCRPLSEPENHCPLPLESDPRAITLTTCAIGNARTTESGPDVCSGIEWRKTGAQAPCTEPGSSVEYTNTIGNNLCYIGRCVENIFEHEEINGRSPMTPQDAGSPWFSVSVSDRRGTIARGGLIAEKVILSYHPQELAQEFDAALCALVGLPRQSPSLLCLGGEGRKLAMASLDYAGAMQKFLQQQSMQEERFAGMGEQAVALGRAHGQILLVRALQSRMNALTSVLDESVQLLGTLRNTSFPTQMCPFSITAP